MKTQKEPSKKEGGRGVKRLVGSQINDPNPTPKNGSAKHTTRVRSQINDPNPTPRQERRQQRRELILDAAERLFREHGENITLHQLAQEAKTSRVTLYEYFANKEAIFRVLSEERGVAWEKGEGGDVRTRILQATRKVFGTLGIGQATMEAIAQEAGVGTVTVYRHFQDKTGLIQAFLESIRPKQAMDELYLASHTSLEQALASFAAKAVEIISQHQDIVRLAMTQISHPFDELEALRKRPGRTVERLTLFFQEQIQQGNIHQEDPRELAISFVGMVMAFAWMYPSVEGEQVADPEHIGALVARMFVRGVGKQP